MNINTSLISNNNSYAGQTPLYIVIHNTDNTAETADAKAHATAQHNGKLRAKRKKHHSRKQKDCSQKETEQYAGGDGRDHKAEHQHDRDDRQYRLQRLIPLLPQFFCHSQYSTLLSF